MMLRIFVHLVLYLHQLGLGRVPLVTLRTGDAARGSSIAIGLRDSELAGGRGGILPGCCLGKVFPEVNSSRGLMYGGVF